MLNDNNIKPIFIQIKEWVENEVLEDRLKIGEKTLSQNELARLFSINPMTALKGISLLESNGVLVKRRGVGMFVTEDAKAIIYAARMHQNLSDIIDDLVSEAMVLKLPKEEILVRVIRRFDNLSGNE